jgi:uncharacterized membrane protein (DUF485 family)
MQTIDQSWNEVYATADFHDLVRRRRRVTFRLLAVSMLFFFSIPVISQFAPEFFRIKVFGSINVGLIYLVSQYFFGIFIACCYAVQLRGIDKLVTCIKEAMSRGAQRPKTFVY